MYRGRNKACEANEGKCGVDTRLSINADACGPGDRDAKDGAKKLASVAASFVAAEAGTHVNAFVADFDDPKLSSTIPQQMAAVFVIWSDLWENHSDGYIMVPFSIEVTFILSAGKTRIHR